MDSASVAAFNAYRVSSRTFNLDDFVQVSSDIVVQKLEHAGAIIREGSVAYFDHHPWKHDFIWRRNTLQLAEGSGIQTLSDM